MDSNKITDHTHIAEFFNNFLKTEGLSFSLYKQYWQALNSSDAATTYLVVLLTKLYLLEVNEDKQPSSLLDGVQKVLRGETISLNPSSDKIDDENQTLKQSVINTIYFAALFLSFEGEDTHIKTILNRWQSLDKSRNIDSFLDELLKIVSGSLDGNDRTISLIDQGSNVEVSNAFDWSLPLEKYDAKSISSSFIDIYLRNCLTQQGKTSKDKDKSKLIIETILLFLKHPLLSEKRMLCLLHMLKSYITRSPKLTYELLSSALTIVRPYYLWPRPHSEVAREVLQMLTIELKSPGAALRKIITEECPELNKGGNNRTGKERTVFVLLDDSTLNGRKFRELLRCSTVPNEINIQQIQVNLLANILSSALSIEHDTIGIELLPRDEINKFYDASIQILSEAVLMSQEDAEAYRIKELQSLRNEIQTIVDTIISNGNNTVTNNGMKARQPSLPPLLFQVHSINCDNTMKQGTMYSNTTNKYAKRGSMDVLSNIIDQFISIGDPKNRTLIRVGLVGGDNTLHNIVTSYVCLRNTNPKLFENVDLEFFFMPTEACDFGIFLSKLDGWYNRHIYCGIQALLRCLPSIMAPPATSNNSNKDLLNNSSSSSSNLINSNNNSSSNLNDMPAKAKSWSNPDVDRTLEQLKVTLANRSNTQLPTPMINTNNNSGNNIGINRTKSGEPQVGLYQDLKTIYELDDKFTVPSLLRTQMENYFREAKCKMDMYLYQCECYGDINNSNVPSYSIPFCQRIDLGIKPFTKAFQKANEIPDTMTTAAIQQHKSFKYSPPAFSIKYTQMNILGAVKQAPPPLDNKPYNSVVISNIPNPNDKSIPPNPTKPWLEMFTIEYDSKKRKGKGKDKEQDDVSCYHVSQLELECDDKKKLFHILVDNVLYGPFFKIRVTPCSVNQDEILTLPIMTFFPLDLQ